MGHLSNMPTNHKNECSTHDKHVTSFVKFIFLIDIPHSAQFLLRKLSNQSCDLAKERIVIPMNAVDAHPYTNDVKSAL